MVIYRPLTESSYNHNYDAYLLEAEEGEGFFARIKNFFVRIWNAIKEFFAKIFGKSKKSTEENQDWLKENAAKLRDGYKVMSDAGVSLTIAKDSYDFNKIWKLSDGIMGDIKKQTDTSAYISLFDPSDADFSDDGIKSLKDKVEQKKKEISDSKENLEKERHLYTLENDANFTLPNPDVIIRVISDKIIRDKQIETYKAEVDSIFKQMLRSIESHKSDFENKAGDKKGNITTYFSQLQILANAIQSFILFSINRLASDMSKAESEVMTLAKKYVSYAGKKPEDIKDDQKKITIGTVSSQSEAYLIHGDFGMFSEVSFV